MVAAYRDPDKSRGRQLMQSLIDSLAQDFPDSLTELVTLGRDPEGAGSRRARLLRAAPHLQRTHRSHQRPARARARLGARLHQPHQLHRQIAPRSPRIQATTTPWTAKSPQADHSAGRSLVLR